MLQQNMQDRGHGPSLDAALAHCGCSLTSEALASAAWAGRTAACKRLLAEGCKVTVEAARAAAEAGHLRLCSLLWSKRCRDYTCAGEVETYNALVAEDPLFYRVKRDYWDVLRVAETACFGGHAAVLRWLERDAGLYDVEHKRQEINMELAAAAARGGHVSLLHRLLAKLAAPRDDPFGGTRLFCDVALGCPLPVFRDLAERWRNVQPPWVAAADGDGCAILLNALWSSSPDWKEKVPSCSGDGRILDTSAAPVCVLAATAASARSASLWKSGFWSKLFDHAASWGADIAALRYLHEQLGAEVPLLPIAQGGSVEQLEWALGVAAGGAGAAAPQGPAPAAQDLLLSALKAGNLAAASHLFASGLAPVLPTADQVSGHYYGGKAGAAGGAAAVGGPAGGAAAGLADAEWDKLLAAVGEDGRLIGCFSENQWEWLSAAFLASPVLPHATAASTPAGGLVVYRTTKNAVTNKRKQAAAASAGAAGFGRTAAAQVVARAEHERERERERGRLAAVMAARWWVAAGVEQGFRAAIAWEEELKARAYEEADSQYKCWLGLGDD
ncbi:hypothetical protein HXX76_009290 [Chlamydomonas incerta]|uniref:Uncharacterized protein n=1 Tax=Chlamydomonas incerta TaxID=51695 RepID=A0A835T4X4_CHLIN|nr:hypothetical protein HXX76_009290 [Chlamydomonas incerta]|eukprot:KAG2431795.1 hypothetical protein HXX76_009290 [Chlamydomonas incerta]